MESAESAVWTRDCNEWKFEDHSGLEAPGFSTFSFPLKFFKKNKEFVISGQKCSERKPLEGTHCSE